MHLPVATCLLSTLLMASSMSMSTYLVTLYHQFIKAQQNNTNNSHSQFENNQNQTPWLGHSSRFVGMNLLIICVKATIKGSEVNTASIQSMDYHMVLMKTHANKLEKVMGVDCKVMRTSVRRKGSLGLSILLLPLAGSCPPPQRLYAWKTKQGSLQQARLEIRLHQLRGENHRTWVKRRYLSQQGLLLRGRMKVSAPHPAHLQHTSIGRTQVYFHPQVITSTV